MGPLNQREVTSFGISLKYQLQFMANEDSF